MKNTDIISILNDIKEKGTQTDSKIAEVLLLDLNNCSSWTVKEISNKAFTSPATVVRFAKHCGLTGFPDLKFVVSRQLELHSGDQTGNIKKAKDIKDVIQNQLENYQSSLNATAFTLNEYEINQVVTKMVAASKIDIYSVGGTNIIGQDLQLKLNRLNVPSTAYADYHMQCVQAKNSDCNTLGIGISFSGETTEVLNALKLSKDNGATTVLISKEGVNVGADYIDHNLFISSNESVIRNISTSSRVALLFAVDIIFSEYFRRNIEENKNRLEKTKFYRGKDGLK